MPARVKPTLIDLPVEIQAEIFKYSLPDTWRLCLSNDTHTFTAATIDHDNDLKTCSGDHLRKRNFNYSNHTKDLLLINKHLSSVVRRALPNLITPTMIFCSHICARRFNRLYPKCPYLQPGKHVQVMFHVHLRGLERLTNASHVLRDLGRNSGNGGSRGRGNGGGQGRGRGRGRVAVSNQPFGVSFGNAESQGGGHGRGNYHGWARGRGHGHVGNTNQPSHSNSTDGDNQQPRGRRGRGRERASNNNDGNQPPDSGANTHDLKGTPRNETPRDWGMSTSEVCMVLKVDGAEMYWPFVRNVKIGVFQRTGWDHYLMTRTYKFVQIEEWKDEGVDFWI